MKKLLERVKIKLGVELLDGREKIMWSVKSGKVGC
jgi:hypothetical protein